MTTGIIGKPIKHSLSPILHEFWMKEHKIESTYNIYEIDKNDIAFFLKTLKEKNINGLNVTIPYKSEVIKLLDHVEKNALDLGAVNTIKVGGRYEVFTNMLLEDVIEFENNLHPLNQSEIIMNRIIN